MNYEWAPKELRIQMSLVDRKFYANRAITVLACKCLINDAFTIAMNYSGKLSRHAAQPGRKLKAKGKPIV